MLQEDVLLLTAANNRGRPFCLLYSRTRAHRRLSSTYAGEIFNQKVLRMRGCRALMTKLKVEQPVH
jgi:hypothetical protein